MICFMNMIIISCIVIMAITLTQQKLLRLSNQIIDSASLLSNNNFQDIYNEQIVEIHIFQCLVTEQGLIRMFQLNLSSLKVFNFTKNNLNPKLARILLSQPFISKLSTLILDGCNLSCEDITALNFSLSSIQTLSLKQNFISQKGIIYLSKLPLILKSLNLFGNSLVHNQSVSALKQMNLTNLVQLNIGKTGISEHNVVELLSKLQTHRLVNLAINMNTFSAQFYKQLAAMNFSSLKRLNLTGLEIDNDGFDHLATLELPALQQLDLKNNRLQSKTAKILLTNKTMPLLHSLNLSNLDVTQTIILLTGKYSNLHSQRFMLRQLNINIIAMTYVGLEKLSVMNLSKLEIFEFGDCTVNPEALDLFFSTAKMPQLRVLKMDDMSNSDNLLSYIFKCKLPKLQHLQIGDIGEINTFLHQIQVRFTNLHYIKFKHYSFNCSELRQIIVYLIKIASALRIIEIVAIQPACLVESIANRTLDIPLSSSIKLIISKLASAITFAPTSKCLEIVLNPNKKSQIIILEVIKIYHMITAYQIITNRAVNKPMPGTIEYFQNLNMFINDSFPHFDFSQLTILADTSYMFFLSWFERHSNFKCSLPKLNTLNGLIATNQNLALLHRCKMPSIDYLSLSFLSVISVRAQIPLFRHLKILHFQNIGIVTLKNIFEMASFQNIQHLVLPALKLTPEDMRAILKQIAYPNKLREQNIVGNFLNSDISFITQDFKLKSLSLNNILMLEGPINQLCNINTQFLQRLQLSNIGLDDNKFIPLINCWQNKSRNQSFPKLKIMNLASNYLQTSGIQTLMSNRLPLLQQFNFELNRDPQIFNSIFKYSSSRRLNAFISSKNYLSSIDTNINPTFTKRLVTIMIESTSIRSTDLQALSKFQLNLLIAVLLKLSRVDSCESLSWIQTITQNAGLIVQLSKSSGINSSCLQNKKNSRIAPANVLVQIEYPYGEARHFVEYFFNKGQHLNMIHMSGLFISDEKLIQIARESDCQKVQQINLQKNDLSDHAIRSLLDRQYPLLKGLSLAGNTRLTSEALSKIQPHHYPSLRNLNIGKTSIGDKGVQYIVRAQYPQLNFITLKDADLTKIGILHLSKLKAPLLTGMDLSCNELSVDDLILLDVDKFEHLKFIVLYPSQKSSDLVRLQTKFNRNKSTPITILTTVELEPIQF